MSHATSSTWETVELPLLNEIRRAEEEDREPEILGLLQEQGISDARAATIIERLRSDHLIDGIFRSTMGPKRLPFMSDVRLTGRGARAVGMWPSSDQGSAFLSALKAAADQEPEPETRSRLLQAVQAFKGVPAAVLTEIIVASAKQHGAIP